MRDTVTLRRAFGKAAGFFYAVVVSVVANLVFAYVLPHGSMPENAAAARQAAAIAPLPPASPPVVAAVAPPPIATASAAPPPGMRPGPGSGGLY